MLDCYITEEEKGIFVENFEIKDRHILVHYANGKTELIKRTVENNGKLLAIMNSQIKDLEEQFEIVKSNKRLFVLMVILSIICIGIAAIIPLVALFNLQIVACFVLGALTIGNFKLHIKNIKKYQKLYEKNRLIKTELEKFKIYLSNQKNLEEHTISIDTINEINMSQDDVQSRSLDGNININLIDKMSLEDLKKLVLYLKKMENLKLERFETGEHDTGYQKTIGLMPGSELENTCKD